LVAVLRSLDRWLNLPKGRHVPPSLGVSSADERDIAKLLLFIFIRWQVLSGALIIQSAR
jgi:hypothetical protein